VAAGADVLSFEFGGAMARTKEVFDDIVRFEIRGVKQDFNFNKDVFVRVCEVLLEEHPDTFGHCCAALGRDRIWIQRGKDGFSHPKRLGKSEYYVQTNLNTLGVVTMSKRIWEIFGHRPSDLVIEVRRREKD
jgi:hypothetical protein